MNGPPTPPPSFVRLGPPVPVTPLVVTVPHAGRFYPPALEAARAVSQATLEQLEDRHVDRLIGPLVDDGAVALVATHARAWIDLNRGEEDGIDRAGAQSLRARAGLGIVPQRLGGRALWRHDPTANDIARRIEAIHRPYHAAIARALAAARARHGFALLLDCHSMPPLGRAGAGAAQIVIGDRHGTSAASAIGAAATAAAEAHGLRVARNLPYAGAHTLERHGRAGSGIDALQIEIDRTLYLDPASRAPGHGAPWIARLLGEMGARMLAAAAPGAFAHAAE